MKKLSILIFIALFSLKAICQESIQEFDIGAQFDDSSPSLPTENNYSHLRMTRYRALHLNLRDSSGNEFGLSTNPIFNKIVGGSDNEIIGNNGDRLKVDAVFSGNTSPITAWSNKIVYNDMNTSFGGIARGTSIPQSTNWTNIYSRTGSGFLIGTIINVETFSGWEFRLLVDGFTVFSFTSDDLTSDIAYDVDDIADLNQAFIGISKGAHDRFIFHSPLANPIYYSTSLTVQIRKLSGGAKKYQAGLLVLTKET